MSRDEPDPRVERLARWLSAQNVMTGPWSKAKEEIKDMFRDDAKKAIKAIDGLDSRYTSIRDIIRRFDKEYGDHPGVLGVWSSSRGAEGLVIQVAFDPNCVPRLPYEFGGIPVCAQEGKPAVQAYAMSPTPEEMAAREEAEEALTRAEYTGRLDRKTESVQAGAETGTSVSVANFQAISDAIHSDSPVVLGVDATGKLTVGPYVVSPEPTKSPNKDTLEEKIKEMPLEHRVYLLSHLEELAQEKILEKRFKRLEDKVYGGFPVDPIR